jgi:bacterioferritin-associated ferredoxin
LTFRNMVELQMRAIRIYTEATFHIRSPHPATMIVCVCRRVSDREIARHARAGMSFDEIQFELGVATQCGQCEGCARDVVAQCGGCHPVAALRHETAASRLAALPA